MNDQFLTELQNVMGGSGIFMEEPMKKHTTFRVGGPADVLVQPCLLYTSTVICDENFSVLDWVHGSWIDVDVRVEFLHGNFVSTCF